MDFKNHKHKYTVIVFLTSILLISISTVSSIGVCKNRSFYFDGYIYNSCLSYYCNDLYRYITNNMTHKEAELFNTQNDGVYYYITDGNTKEVFTNIPKGKNYNDFFTQKNIVSLKYTNEQNSFLIASYDEKVIVTHERQQENSTYSFSGYVFIDNNIGEFLPGSFRTQIKDGFKLQRILIIESCILITSFILGIMLFLLTLKKAVKSIVIKSGFIPIDVKLGVDITALSLWILLYGTYSYTIEIFSAIIRRVSLYGVFVFLTFIIFSFSLILILNTREYLANEGRLYEDWQNRLTKNIPSWIIGLVLQVSWYFFILIAVSPASTIYDLIALLRKRWIVVIVHNVIILLVFLLIRQIQKSKEKYINEVLSSVQKISNGDLNLNVPVKGNDFLSKIANQINIIKVGHIHALNEYKKSERLKYELVTNISHDLRSPLTSILNYIELVKKKGINADVEKYIDHASENAKRLNILIEDLFELSKMESGNIQLDISNVNIVLMIKQICNEYDEKMKQNGLELILVSASKQIMWQCDRIKIWRVFDNLINNAVKYSLRGSRIYIYIEEQSEQLEISVKNIVRQRIDFEPDELFLRFKRGDSARSSEGSGLGLAIVKSIVARHNGKIGIEIDGDLFKINMLLRK